MGMSGVVAAPPELSAERSWLFTPRVATKGTDFSFTHSHLKYSVF